MRNVLIFMILILPSCTCIEKKENQVNESISGLVIEPSAEIKSNIDLENEIDYSILAELFANDVLNENIRTHVFDLTNSESPKHLRIFQSDELEKLIAYSDKNFPENSIPNYYEQFILFVATFNNQNSAEETFKRIKSDSKYERLELNKLEKELFERVASLNIGAKPGGMITQKGKQILSLVKTCRKTPKGGSWKNYENEFLGFMTNKGDEIEVLKSHCGSDRYRIEKIKVSW